MEAVTSQFDAGTGIGRITLNRPEVLNAIDAASARALLVAVRKLTAEQGLRCIVMAGAGRAFAAGGDVASFAAGGPEQTPHIVNELLDAIHAAIIALRASPAPVITAVHGAAAGAGLSLALSGDLVVAASDARFVVAYDRLGTSPDCGLTWFLPRRVGRGRAFDMMLTGAVLTAEDALAAGLADRVEPLEGFAAAVDALATRIASGPTLAYGRFKRLMDVDLPLAEHLEAERAAFIASTRTADFQEGVSAFIAKRKPEFKGA